MKNKILDLNLIFQNKNNKLFIIKTFRNNINKQILIKGRICRNFRDFGKILFFNINNYFFTLECISKIKNLNQQILKITAGSIIELQGILKIKKKIKKLSNNLKIFFKQIELDIKLYKIISLSKNNINININDDKLINKTFKQRFLIIRNQTFINNLKYRTLFYKFTHDFFIKKNFLFIKTPKLSFKTNEGSKSFIIKHHTGNIALSQSPQIYKELILLNAKINFPGYYQITDCFRNEDLRANRQYEFEQLDIEMISKNFLHIKKIIQKFVKFIIFKIFKKKNILFHEITFQESMNRFRNDKPFLEKALSDIIIQKKEKDTIFFILDKKILFTNDFFNKIKTNFNIKFVNTKNSNNIFKIKFNLLKTFTQKIKFEITKYNNTLKFLWITDFPLFRINNDNQIISTHHPFVLPCNPKKTLDTILKLNINKLTNIDIKNLSKLKGQSFDLIFKGNEILSGSLRINDEILQKNILYLIKKNKLITNNQYNFFFNSFNYAANNIGGCAIGIDRFVSLLLNYNSIKSTLIFPRNKSGKDMII